MRTNRRIFVVWLAVSLLVPVLLLRSASSGMMPGVAEPTKTAAEPAKEQASSLQRTWQEKYWAEDSPYRGLIVSLGTIVVLIIGYRFATRRLRNYLKNRAYKPENVLKFMRTWKSVWTFFITVFALISLSGSLKWLGISAGFMGMMLGWSLQAPVTGMAAWLMIIAKKPFKIGDRVIIGGVIGDVTDITLTHVILNQVGGTVAGEEQSGRGILIPNAILFSQIITNYTLEQKFMLDEVVVRVSFNSDMELAKKLLLEAANIVTKDIITEIGQKPFLRLELYDSGLWIRLRYQTIPAERQRISSEIVDLVVKEFADNYPKVRFAYNQSVVRYLPEEGAAPPVAVGKT